MTITSRGWWSLHIFITDPDLSERFLVERVAPAVQDLIKRGKASGWFFIRYWEGGPHLRLRLADIAPAVQIELGARLRAELVHWRSPTPAIRELYYANHSFDGQAIPLDTLPWYDEGSAVEIPYEPEIVRYGGPTAMSVSEDLFNTSSAIARHVIAATLADTHRRAASAFALMLATAAALSPDEGEIARFCHDYAALWQPFSQQTRQLARQVLAPPTLGHLAAITAQMSPEQSRSSIGYYWRQAVERFKRDVVTIGDSGRLVSPLNGRTAVDASSIREALRAIIFSHLHMLNNRLGIMPSQELMLARIIAAAADARSKSVTGGNW